MTQEEFISRIRHACWCAYQLGAGLDYNLEPTSYNLASHIDGVRAFLNNPAMTASENHDSWMRCRLSAGWVYGEVKDVKAKTHPDLVPFDKLPLVEQNKDIMDLDARRLGMRLWAERPGA